MPAYGIGKVRIKARKPEWQGRRRLKSMRIKNFEYLDHTGGKDVYIDSRINARSIGCISLTKPTGGSWFVGALHELGHEEQDNIPDVWSLADDSNIQKVFVCDLEGRLQAEMEAWNTAFKHLDAIGVSDEARQAYHMLAQREVANYLKSFVYKDIVKKAANESNMGEKDTWDRLCDMYCEWSSGHVMELPYAYGTKKDFRYAT